MRFPVSLRPKTNARRARPSHRRFALALSLVTLASALAVPSVAVPAIAAESEQITHTLTRDGRTVTVRLSPISMRAPNFEVLVQQSDGSFLAHTAVPERSWFGTVDEDPSASVAGIVRADGTFEGQVVFDRGYTWFFTDDTVKSTRGSAESPEYLWPVAAKPERMLTTSPGQAGTTTHRWDVGYDLTNTWFTDAASVAGSVDRALEEVELSTVAMLSFYEGNALMRPATGRVIVRASAAVDPYATYTSSSSLLHGGYEQWGRPSGSPLRTDVVDNVVVRSMKGSGGLAYVGTEATEWASAFISGRGWSTALQRHELGHNWGVGDLHSGRPEGRTINSGNAQARFDGTELSAIFRTRDKRIARFTPEGTFAPDIPPYAALDLVDSLPGGVPVTVSPLANDHDANGDTLSLTSVAPSKLGVQPVVAGGAVTYTPPVVSQRTLDWFEYRITDASGQTATGVALLRIEPGAPAVAPVAPAAPSATPPSDAPSDTPPAGASSGDESEASDAADRGTVADADRPKGSGTGTSQETSGEASETAAPAPAPTPPASTPVPSATPPTSPADPTRSMSAEPKAKAPSSRSSETSVTALSTAEAAETGATETAAGTASPLMAWGAAAGALLLAALATVIALIRRARG